MRKRIFFFGKGSADGNFSLRKILGGKGANLAEMSRMGAPVPSGFTISTEVCLEYFLSNQRMPLGLMAEVREAMDRLGHEVGRKFGDQHDPLLVSVRSGSSVSMPGMMDTILNLGFSRSRVEGFSKVFGNIHFAWDTYRRFLQMFGNVVFKIPSETFEILIDEIKSKEKVEDEIRLSVEGLEKLATSFESIVEEKMGRSFPEDPMEQLALAIEAVFQSWNNPRALRYREFHGINHDVGTAVTVQAMVFGNRNQDSATGVLFSRDPSTGRRGLVGEYLLQAQGEDVVAGIRTPLPLRKDPHVPLSSFEEKMPLRFEELSRVALELERHYRDMQDIEFTVENNVLWILQTRSGKRTAAAALQIAVDLVQEGLIHRKDAVMLVDPEQINQVLHPRFSEEAARDLLAKGLPASPGAAVGKAVFSADDAETWAKRGESVVLIRNETSPEDIHGMHSAKGILTGRGGMTSHAAVVARGMGRTCVVGCSSIQIEADKKQFRCEDGRLIREGDVVSLDGTRGEVYLGEVPTEAAKIDDTFRTFMAWADGFRRLKIRANADRPEDCKIACDFGCEGVGLCRTEHMFFDKDRIDLVRLVILSVTRDERMSYLSKLQDFQLNDFREIFRVMKGLPVTVRLLDPPLHEFLPKDEQELGEFCKRVGMDVTKIRKRVEALHEVNPMLGHRGCRLGITFPEIYDMQVRAIIRGACEIEALEKERVSPEIMIPFISDPDELKILQERVKSIAEEVRGSLGSHLFFTIGTMIEIPRAALMAKSIARYADFFSFGTNDLTQMTYGMSRDDSGKFFHEYVQRGIFEKDPFATMDREGVLELVKIGTSRGKEGNPRLKIGICGEHGGDPDSIREFHRLGFNYVSCSPFRVPIARLAAAQVSIMQDEREPSFSRNEGA